MISSGARQVRLRQAQHRMQPAGERRDQAAVDETRAGRGIGERADDQQLLRVRHDHPLVRVVVVRGAAQHRRAVGHPHDPGQRVRPAGRVAHQVHQVADDDRGATQLAGPHGDDLLVRLAVQRTGPAPAVDADDHRRAGVRVLGTNLRAGPGALARAYPDVGLVQAGPVRPPPARHAPSPASIVRHMAGKSGSVFAVVAMSSTTTPGTTSPTIAPAVAIRWSA